MFTKLIIRRNYDYDYYYYYYCYYQHAGDDDDDDDDVLAGHPPHISEWKLPSSMKKRDAMLLITVAVQKKSRRDAKYRCQNPQISHLFPEN